MNFTHPWYLLLLPPALAWVLWLALKSDAHLGPARRWVALGLRLAVLLLLLLAIAGLQFLRPIEGMNVFFVLDRSDSVPSPQQEFARDYVNTASAKKKAGDRAGVIVFGTQSSIESLPNQAVNLQKVQAVVGTDRTDLAAAVRLGTAAFPETGQKRLVLLTDGNENAGDALSAVLAARPLGVTVDVMPLGVARAMDISVQKLQVPSRLKRSQSFEAKIFVHADQAAQATVRLYRNEEFLGEQKVDLAAGKNLFTFPQTLAEAGFHSYDVQLDVPGDPLPQNNRASAFTTVQGEPRVLVVSSDPSQEESLVAALKSTRFETALVGIEAFPGTLAEMQSYDAIFLSNIAAGDLGTDRQKLLESAVRDFGIGLVCIGGDQAFTAGGYRGTPLETTLPVSMELDSKKVLPSGAVVLVMHGMEFNNGNQVARDCAQGVLAALGPQDEMGVLLWDGTERWLFTLQKVATKAALAQEIAGMNQGDLGSFQNILGMARDGLRASKANLKHIIVFSDGDPGAPSSELMQSIVSDRITVSTILISGHVGPETMIWIAENGRGRFYNVTSPDELPQVFLKETAVILKSAIYEEPFKPQLRASSELVRGIPAESYPSLLGYVATSTKPRAEIPLWTDKGDPLLAHWQYGLGRAVAFTSDAKPRWARLWLNWEKYRQFWSQIAQWSLRRLDSGDFATEVSVENGQGFLSIDASDDSGNYRNFLNLQAVVVSPKGERQTVRIEQTGPGHYEARFPTRESGSYLLNLIEMKDGRVRSSQVVGASVNYSPEFNTAGANLHLLARMAESAGGKLLSPLTPALNPFLHDRKRTFQPQPLWDFLLKLAVVLFVFDVGVRRVQIERDEWAKAWLKIRQKFFGSPIPARAEEPLSVLLAKRHAARPQPGPPGEAPPELFQPKHEPMETYDAGGISTAQPAAAQPPAHPAEVPQPPPDETLPPASTASRLLEAKRRAQERHKKP